MNLTIESKSYRPKCNFQEKITLCNKTNYPIKKIYDLQDLANFGKIIEVVTNISLYVFSLFGLFTNSIVVFIILNKKNGLLYIRHVYLLSGNVF